LKLPGKESDDILGQSKFHKLLEHDGIPFRLEHKKQLLRNIELEKKSAITGKGATPVVVLRNFKQVYEQEPKNKVKLEFRDLRLKKTVKQEEMYMVNLLDLTPDGGATVSPNYGNAVVVNRIACGDARDQKENLDQDFGALWQSTVWGGKVP
jgi:hypothetical protein